MSKMAELAGLVELKDLEPHQQFLAVSDCLQRWVTLYRMLAQAAIKTDSEYTLDLLCTWARHLHCCEHILSSMRDELIRVSDDISSRKCETICASSAHELTFRLVQNVVQSSWISACKHEYGATPSELALNSVTVADDPRPLLLRHWAEVVLGLAFLPIANAEQLESAIERERALVQDRISPRWSKLREKQEWLKQLQQQLNFKGGSRTFARRCEDGTFRVKPGGTKRRISLDLRDLPNFNDDF